MALGKTEMAKPAIRDFSHFTLPLNITHRADFAHFAQFCSVFSGGALASSVTFQRKWRVLVILLGLAHSCSVPPSFSWNTFYVARITLCPIHSKNRHVFCVALCSVHSRLCFLFFVVLVVGFFLSLGLVIPSFPL